MRIKHFENMEPNLLPPQKIVPSSIPSAAVAPSKSREPFRSPKMTALSPKKNGILRKGGYLPCSSACLPALI